MTDRNAAALTGCFCGKVVGDFEADRFCAWEIGCVVLVLKTWYGLLIYGLKEIP